MHGIKLYVTSLLLDYDIITVCEMTMKETLWSGQFLKCVILTDVLIPFKFCHVRVYMQKMKNGVPMHVSTG